jgi:hypothetical protein
VDFVPTNHALSSSFITRSLLIKALFSECSVSERFKSSRWLVLLRRLQPASQIWCSWMQSVRRSLSHRPSTRIC